MIKIRLVGLHYAAALAAYVSMFIFGIGVGSYFAQRPHLLKPLFWASSYSYVGSGPSQVQYSLHTNVSSQLSSHVLASGLNELTKTSSMALDCQAYPSSGSDVVIVVKTGATEAIKRIPTQLLTFLSCAKDDVLFFSDMEQDIGSLHLYDALEKVVPRARKVNSDFDLYEMQKQVKLLGEDVENLSKGKEAWALDKYKNIHTAQKAWELRPNKTWYFFIDADTYIVWPSFFAWVKRLDPVKDQYLGRTIHTDNLFAHGGSGYMISRTAMLQIVNGTDASQIAADFDISASTTCCGDAEIAGSLSHKNVSLIDAYPQINYHKPRNMPYGPSHWCQPIISMHHMGVEEVNDMWQFERSRTSPRTPLLLKDIFSSYISPRLSSMRTDWENLSDEVAESFKAPGKEQENEDKELRNPEIESAKQHSRLWPVTPHSHDYDYRAVQNCARACSEIDSCFQYQWDGKECKISTKFFRLGGMKNVGNDEKRWVSGWDLERIREFQRQHDNCGDGLWDYDP